MKIRTVTAGFNLNPEKMEKQIKTLGEFLEFTKKIYEDYGYEVQTLRIATQPWEKYYKSEKQMLNLVKNIEELIFKYKIDYFNIGTTFNTDSIPFIYKLIKKTKRLFCTVMVSYDRQINYEAAKLSAKLIKNISKLTAGGFENLRFAALFNTGPKSPFYPASYHKGRTAFAVGTENSDLVFKAFSKAKNVEMAEKYLYEILNFEFRKLEEISRKISKEKKIMYNGIDLSIAPSIHKNESIAFAIEKLGINKFGEAGTLAIAKIITDTLKNIGVKKCGYSGLMLPVLEDYGLAKRNSQNTYDIFNLLNYSAVCGAGLDTIPLPGDVHEKKLYLLLLDIASLAIKLNKPLSARLMPVPGKKAGDDTQFHFEYFVNSKVMDI